MDNLLVVAFITGITTGGLSCLAVQGGLVTSSIAQNIEEELRNRPQSARKKTRQLPRRNFQIARPILFFLLAKVVAHTLLGFLLGWAGSLLTLTPTLRGVLQLGIGLFMIGNALRMFNLHPIFRYFSFEPPRAVTRFIRRTSKNNDQGNLTALLLGGLTVLIPCGITQAMMATAIGAGSPLLGAMIMASFVLGTSPVFFGVTYLAARLGSLLEKQLMRLTAVVLLILGLVAVNNGLNLTGSPFSFTRVLAAASDPTGGEAVVPTLSVYDPNGTSSAALANDAPANEPGVIRIDVKNYGYVPSKIIVPANRPVKLKLVTKGVYSCSRAFVIPALNLERLLPPTGDVILDIAPQQSGSVMQFSCSMGMYTGAIFFQ